MRRERGGGPRERFGHARRGLALEAPTATLESQLGSLDGFAGVGALRDAQGVLGVTGVVLRVSERLFGIPSERFGVEGGWSGSGRPRRDFAVQEGRGSPHVVWEALGVVKVAESWHPSERDPQSPHGPPQISPRNSKPPKSRQDFLSSPSIRKPVQGNDTKIGWQINFLTHFEALESRRSLSAWDTLKDFSINLMCETLPQGMVLEGPRTGLWWSYSRNVSVVHVTFP